MKRILEFQEFMDRESKTRTKGLNEKEFLEVFRKNCKNFSFKNATCFGETQTTLETLGCFSNQIEKEQSEHITTKIFSMIERIMLYQDIKVL